MSERVESRVIPRILTVDCKGMCAPVKKMGLVRLNVLRCVGEVNRMASVFWGLFAYHWRDTMLPDDLSSRSDLVMEGNKSCRLRRTKWCRRHSDVD